MDNYEKKGPKAVIIFHAFTGTPNDVVAVGRALERENYTVMMPTFAGHGSDDPDEVLEYGIEDWVRNGEEAYQTLVDDGYTNITVSGLSLGGIIATHLMLKYDVQSAGVFSSPIMADRDLNIPENFWKWYQFKKRKQGLENEEIAAKENEVMSKLQEVLDGVNEHIKTMMPEYSEVTLPVFIGQGGDDEMIDANIAFDFQDALEKAIIDFHWYEDASHVITIGAVGKQLQNDFIAFLEEYTH